MENGKEEGEVEGKGRGRGRRCTNKKREDVLK